MDMADDKTKPMSEREAGELATIYAITSVARDIKEDIRDAEEDESVRAMPDPDYMKMVVDRRAAYLEMLRKQGQIAPLMAG
jgi:hypothetical protein